MVVRNMVEDGIEDFDQNHHLDSLDVLVFGNMNDIDNRGMVGLDTECYAVQGIHWMVGVIMDGVGRGVNYSL